jgi:hypothetical protein
MDLEAMRADIRSRVAQEMILAEEQQKDVSGSFFSRFLDRIFSDR